jgi:hypothetical protein
VRPPRGREFAQVERLAEPALGLRRRSTSAQALAVTSRRGLERRWSRISRRSARRRRRWSGSAGWAGAVGLVVERDVARHDGEVEGRQASRMPSMAADELAHDLGPLRIAEVHVVGDGERQGADRRQVAPGFGHRLHGRRSSDRPCSSAACSRSRHGQRLDRRASGTRTTRGIAALRRLDRGIAHDQMVVLLPDPAACEAMSGEPMRLHQRSDRPRSLRRRRPMAAISVRQGAGSGSTAASYIRRFQSTSGAIGISPTIVAVHPGKLTMTAGIGEVADHGEVEFPLGRRCAWTPCCPRGRASAPSACAPGFPTA